MSAGFPLWVYGLHNGISRAWGGPIEFLLELRPSPRFANVPTLGNESPVVYGVPAEIRKDLRDFPVSSRKYYVVTPKLCIEGYLR